MLLIPIDLRGSSGLSFLARHQSGSFFVLFSAPTEGGSIRKFLHSRARFVTRMQQVVSSDFHGASQSMRACVNCCPLAAKAVVLLCVAWLQCRPRCAANIRLSCQRQANKVLQLQNLGPAGFTRSLVLPWLARVWS